MIAKTKRMIVMMKKTRMKVRVVINLGLRLNLSWGAVVRVSIR